MNERLKVWLKAIRVDQWTKNGVVMMAWFFSVADASQREIVRGWESFLMAFAMAGAFSLVSSAFYLLNEANVATVMGSAFGDDACIRLSYATSEDLLIEALRRIKEALANLK